MEGISTVGHIKTSQCGGVEKSAETPLRKAWVLKCKGRTVPDGWETKATMETGVQGIYPDRRILSKAHHWGEKRRLILKVCLLHKHGNLSWDPSSQVTSWGLTHVCLVTPNSVGAESMGQEGLWDSLTASLILSSVRFPVSKTKIEW